MQQLKDAMFTILDEIINNDFFDIVTFSSEASKWSPIKERRDRKFKNTKKNKKMAVDFVLNLNLGRRGNQHQLSPIERNQTRKIGCKPRTLRQRYSIYDSLSKKWRGHRRSGRKTGHFEKHQGKKH